MNIQEVLHEIGLPDREAVVYLAVLELGESTVLPIAKKSGIQRTYCYDILDSLRDKGLVTSLEKDGRRRWNAEPPEKIQVMLKSRLAHFTDLLPELRSIYNSSGTKPKVRFYEGKEGVLTISYELAKAKTMEAISSTDHLYAVLGDYINDVTKKIAKNKVRTRELYARGHHPIQWVEYYEEPLQQIRFLPAGVKIAIDLLLYDNKVALISYEGELHSLVIEGSAIVDSLRVLFELLWQQGEPMQKLSA